MITDKTALHQLSQFQADGKKIVLVTGVFDILHHAHIEFLYKAKAAGDVLVVGIESDARVQSIKGENRPIIGQESRRFNLLKLGIADIIFILPIQFSKPEDHLDLLQLIKPKVLAVSSHTRHLDKKQALMQKIGGNVQVVMQHDPSISTTILLENQKVGSGSK